MGRKKSDYPEIQGIELTGKRKELFEVMNDRFPGGNRNMQKNFCLSIAEERLEVYLKDFRKG
jgi:hypothetical protein